MKYIITDKDEVIIGNGLHWDLADKAKGKVVKAGHVEFDENGKAEVSGQSYGFGIMAETEDAAIIDRLKDSIINLSE